MTTHLSVRLAWHDRGWDGRVCDAPHLNAYCIVHEHIRDARDDERERQSAGRALADLDGWVPPCSRDPGAFAPRRFSLRHEDPLDFRKLPSVEEEIPPYSACPAPYRWMLEEHFRNISETENLSIPGPLDAREAGWVLEPERQLALLTHFWGKLSPAASLVFFYSNHGNPLDEHAARVIVGIGRLSEIGPQLFFGQHPKYPGEHPLWSRRVTHDYPAQGLRLPYQEYLSQEQPTDQVIVRTPPGALLPFSYGAEHVSDDVALVVLDQLVQSVTQVQADGLVPGDWDARLAWLDDVLGEVWRGRGPFPGAGSVLEVLGFPLGTAYQRAELTSIADNGGDPWHHLVQILDGRMEPPDGVFADGLRAAAQRWQLLPERKELLATLARFELSASQVRRIIDPDQRRKSRIDQSQDRLTENPYLICEQDIGAVDSPPIALDTIDHGVRPEGLAAQLTESVAADDRRRVRATGVAVLADAAQAGDALLPLDEFFALVRERFPDRRACPVDRELFRAELEFFERTFTVDYESSPPAIALRELRTFESELEDLVSRRAPRVNRSPDSDWQAALRALFGESTGGRDNLAREEKVRALQTMSERRLSVLTGGAGTGKTSVVRVLLDSLERSEGRQQLLLLAPTGKARVRLSAATRRTARTIHQFLLSQGWIDPETMTLLPEGRAPYQARTVVIDECSMIPTDLMGTLLRALDSNSIQRLILVGDENQLPPIGPGRPFADIRNWLQEQHPECIASLMTAMRVGDGSSSSGVSRALLLASGYRAEGGESGDDEVLSDVARGISSGDLDVAYWDGSDDLIEKIKERLQTDLGIAPGDYAAFNASLGISTRNWKRSEDWQLLSATRRQFFGTDNLNRIIQREFRGGLIASSRRPGKRGVRPFGDEDIVYTDKVIQVRNQQRRAWPPERGGLDYVANGEIGVVADTGRGNGGSDHLDVVFSSQEAHQYRYYRNEIDASLELGYALTVHRAQGSDFDTVFVIIPQAAGTLSRELLYTALTRFKRRLVLLIERDIGPLVRLRGNEQSETRRRRTGLFGGNAPGDGRQAATSPGIGTYMPDGLKHRGASGLQVRSKSEVIISQLFEQLGISFEYEAPLRSRSDPRDFRLPDFTVSYEGDVYYWEHLGMLAVPEYRERWQRKRRWYEANGYLPQLITSEDSPDGAIDLQAITDIARRRILEGQLD